MAALILFSCSDEKVEFIDNPPQLEITVVDISQVQLSGVSVTLYNTEEDWKSKANPVVVDSTDSKGIVVFSDLMEQRYYFFAEKSEMNNMKTVAVIADSLKINVKATIQTIIK